MIRAALALAVLPAMAVAADWAAVAPSLAPALRGCLAGDAAAFATAADLTSPGVVVRIRRGAVWEECLADIGGQVLERRPSTGAAPPADTAAFFLDRRCVDARRVDAADGRVIGWVAYPGC